MEFLQSLTERCAELLEVDAAGLLVADGPGALRLVAASTEQARVAELFQVQHREGPCLDSFRTGQPVIVSDIGSAEAAALWPGFAPAVRSNACSACTRWRRAGRSCPPASRGPW